MGIKDIVDRLADNHDLTDKEYLTLLGDMTSDEEVYLYRRAEELRQSIYGREVYLRGLIEISNYCRNDCYYCGIRRSNRCADRYRLTQEQIMDCCQVGYELGFRTFVLQGGEDPYYNDDRICAILRSIKAAYPDCAITLSIGEKSRESYQAYYDAGADRYLLRHETANPKHYRLLHPEELSLEHRMNCLSELKEIGYQVGCGIMLGSPGQTSEYILEDIRYMQKLQPHMIGIGPFLPHHDTPFALCEKGSLELTIFLLAILRLMFPDVLLPATTALGTIAENGRELGLLAGANVIMPNLSPAEVRKKYLLYDNKVCFGDEAAEARANMEKRIESAGCRAVYTRGDHIGVS